MARQAAFCVRAASARRTRASARRAMRLVEVMTGNSTETSEAAVEKKSAHERSAVATADCDCRTPGPKVPEADPAPALHTFKPSLRSDIESHPYNKTKHPICSRGKRHPQPFAIRRQGRARLPKAKEVHVLIAAASDTWLSGRRPGNPVPTPSAALHGGNSSRESTTGDRVRRFPATFVALAVTTHLLPSGA